MTGRTQREWEEWQLTAYLLGELESEDATRIKTAAANDPQVARQLSELSQTIGRVQSALAGERIAESDRAELVRLQAAATQLCEPQLRESQQAEAATSVATVNAVNVQGQRSWSHRIVRRWENWASLAGLILIAVLLVQRQYGGKPMALNSDAHQPTVASKSPSQKTNQASAVDLQVDHPFDGAVDRSLATTLAKNPELSFGSDFSGSAAALASSAPAPTDSFASRAGETSNMNSALASEAMGSLDSLSDASVSNGMPLVAGNNVSPAMGGMPGGMGMMGSGTDGSGMMGGASNSGMMGGGGGMMGRGRIAMNGPGMGDVGMDAEIELAKGKGRIHPEPFGMGMGVEMGGDRFASITDNPFKPVSQDPLSTFSIDVDTASFSKTRQYLMEYNQAPPPAAVRIEEFINSFDYQYAGPQDDKPFAAALAVSDCPWTPEHKLVRIALQAKQIDIRERPKANLVFLLDVSGSMNEPNKLPLVKESIRLLTYQLQENDRVALVVYAGAAGCVLSSTPGNRQDEILSAIERLNAGGSTNGGQGIQLAYSIAREHFIPGGVNRVILCSDGDFNVGVTGTEELVNLVKEQSASNIFLTVLGYGMGNTNDAMMEQIADKGNGVYGFVDTRREAQRQMVKQLAGNLITVAKDVKIQVEFNPQKIREYRLLGYENRIMAHEDFNNDKKDAGEIGAGHRVTALYEVALVGSPKPQPQVDQLRYQSVQVQPEELPAKSDVQGEASQELLAVKLRYKQPEGTESQLLVFPLQDKIVPYNEADSDFRWAAAMAEFGMLLRNSPYRGQSSWSQLFERARRSADSLEPARAETLEMIRRASQLAPR